MGIDSIKFGPGILYDGNGKAIGTCQTIDDVDTLCIPEETDLDYRRINPVTLSKSVEFELEATFLNVPLINELAGIYSKPKGFDLEWDGFYLEQIRKHKKKRINKKWAKRYGYREIPCRYRMKNAHIQQETFNDFSITTDNKPRIIERY